MMAGWQDGRMAGWQDGMGRGRITIFLLVFLWYKKLKRKYRIYVWYAKTKTIKMAASNVICELSSPSPKTVLCGRKSKKIITIDLSSISSLLNKRRDDTINTYTRYNIAHDEEKEEKEEKEDCLNNNIETEVEVEAETETDAGGGNNGYYYRNRERKLEYQKNYNREQGVKIKNYNKDYYQKRRDEILEKAKTKIICECGCEVQLFNMNSHKKTKKHAKALAAISEKI